MSINFPMKSGDSAEFCYVDQIFPIGKPPEMSIDFPMKHGGSMFFKTPLRTSAGCRGWEAQSPMFTAESLRVAWKLYLPGGEIGKVGWLVVTGTWLLFFQKYDVSLSQLTFIFFRGVETTNQLGMEEEKMGKGWETPFIDLPIKMKMAIFNTKKCCSISVARFHRALNDRNPGR